jgi:hypothetical protein
VTTSVGVVLSRSAIVDLGTDLMRLAAAGR